MHFKVIDPEKWNRKPHFDHFAKFDEPFFDITVNVDCTEAYEEARKRNQSFFLYYLFRSLKAANAIDNFKYRIEGQEIRLYEMVHASPTVSRPDGTFGFAYIEYFESETVFIEEAKKSIDRTFHSTDLLPSTASANILHMTTLPWLHFTSLRHARNYKIQDSCPKIAFGKMQTDGERRLMPLSVSVHHGLADGYHVALFVEQFQQLLDNPAL